MVTRFCLFQQTSCTLLFTGCLALSGNQVQILLSSLGELATTTVNAMLYTYPFSHFSTSPIFSRLRRTERMIEPLAYML